MVTVNQRKMGKERNPKVLYVKYKYMPRSVSAQHICSVMKHPSAYICRESASLVSLSQNSSDLRRLLFWAYRILISPVRTFFKSWICIKVFVLSLLWDDFHPSSRSKYRYQNEHFKINSGFLQVSKAVTQEDCKRKAILLWLTGSEAAKHSVMNSNLFWCYEHWLFTGTVLRYAT
jgi:hypothetical protein